MVKTMKVTPYWLMVASPMMCFSMQNWTLMWISLEISSMSFIMVLAMEKKKEKIFMFFLFQTMATILIMLFIFKMISPQEQSETPSNINLLMVGMFMKIAMFPFHTWMMTMSKKMSWANLMILLTWQKMIPIIMMTKMHMKKNNLSLLCMNMVVISVLMNYLSSMKKVVTSSSIIHNSWMLMPMKWVKSMCLVYLLMYSTIVLTATFILKKFNLKSNSMMTPPKQLVLEISLIMLTLAGIPPTIGFFMSIMVLYSMNKMEMNSMMLMFMFIAASISFYVYFKIFSKTKKMMAVEKNWMSKNKSSMKMKTNWMFIMVPMMILWL